MSDFNAGVEACAQALEKHFGQGPLHAADFRALKRASQPPCDNDHVAPGCERFPDDGTFIDRIDLMLDEFKRIAALVPSGSEIAGLCRRAIESTVQHVPVIAQRDEAEAQVKDLQSRIAEDAEALHMANEEVKRLRAGGAPKMDVPGWRCPTCLKAWAADGEHKNCPPPEAPCKICGGSGVVPSRDPEFPMQRCACKWGTPHYPRDDASGDPRP